MGLIEQEWQSMRERVIHPDAEELQVKEMRMSFYAGAYAMLNIAKALGEPDIPEDQAVQVLKACSAEMEEFCDSLTATEI